ncbi:MAG: HTTM domain-containing protein [Pirellulaceae bacterium]
MAPKTSQDRPGWIVGYVGDVVRLWDQFWFTPRLPYTLAAIRIATGLMLLYTQIVLATRLMAFLGADSWVPADAVRQLHANDYAWSYLWYIDHPTILWLHHALTLAVTFCFACGLMSRITIPLAWFLQLMYMHRLTGSLFGLDQMTTMLTMYLMLTPCGSVWSVDAWLRKRQTDPAHGRRWWLPLPTPSVAANVGTHLLQLHLCVIYLFGGVSKMRGEMWWDGTAMWFAVSNYEYQSLDMTWIVRYPVLFAALSHLTVFWETFYCALVWPRITRPWVIATAFMVHGGIAVALGMITFGTTMIIANCIFIAPEVFRSVEGIVGRYRKKDVRGTMN